MTSDIERPLNWRWRWCVLPSWGRLHRITRIPEQDDCIPIGGKAVSLCGRAGRFGMPGIFSRMDSARCKQCCRIAGVPEGNGAPYNDKTLSKGMRDK